MKDEIVKYLFKGDLDLEFEILDLDQKLKAKGDMMYKPHRAQFYHILWIEKGEGTHYIDFKPVTIQDNTIIFIPQNSMNMYDSKGSYQGKGIIFTDNFFCKNPGDSQYLRSSMLFSDLYDLANIAVPTQMDNLKLFFQAMEDEFHRELDAAKFSILQNLLSVFLLHAEREMESQGFVKLDSSPNLNILVEFKDRLEHSFTKIKSVKQYASDLNLSEKQLHKVTTSLLDKTPKMVIDERILLEAKRLLTHGNQPIKEIAYELGYDEPTNFIKYFRKHVNKTPAEFREQY